MENFALQSLMPMLQCKKEQFLQIFRRVLKLDPLLKNTVEWMNLKKILNLIK